MEPPNLKRTRSQQHQCIEGVSTSKKDKPISKSRSVSTLDFAEPLEVTSSERIIDDSDGDELVLQEIPQERVKEWKKLSQDYDGIDFEYKKRAVEYWRSCKTKHKKKFSCVQKKFRRVTSDHQLKRWEKYVCQGGTYRDKIAQISEITIKYFIEAANKNASITNNDIRRWALIARDVIGLEPNKFCASLNWTLNFKRHYGIVMKKKDNSKE
ncbi:uncharacterized protein [Chelonus insularis]|uniref:uncharacterized protein n=1 Tax=Chelonus insularis TaxID=460826 RepID=UPI00158ABA16|nr:uncharacterized protein LOC118072009 [Chelonus insularis]XP_034947445.1 uncharacterized protein LOC118072009 [Chelonus insularis]